MTKITTIKQLDDLQSSTHFIETDFSYKTAEIFNNNGEVCEVIFRNVFKDVDRLNYINVKLIEFGFDIELVTWKE